MKTARLSVDRTCRPHRAFDAQLVELKRPAGPGGRGEQCIGCFELCPHRPSRQRLDRDHVAGTKVHDRLKHGAHSPGAQHIDHEGL